MSDKFSKTTEKLSHAMCQKIISNQNFARGKPPPLFLISSYCSIAFVEFDTEENAKKALDNLNMTMVNGRKIYVNVSMKKSLKSLL